MIKNYLTVAIRNLMRHKLYTSINVLGLAIGLACGILILLYIQQEFAVNRSHTLGDRIYKVIREQRGSTQTTYEEGTSGALGPVLEETFPEVETTVRIWQWLVSAQYGEHKNQYTLALVDDNFLDVFDFPLIKGDLKTAFRLPYSVVITDDMAQHLFGDADPMGKTISVDNRYMPGEYTVTGIVKAPQLSSELYFQLLTTTIPSAGRTPELWKMWLPGQSWRPVNTYVLLKAGQNAETLKTKMQSLIVQYMGDDVAAKNTYHLQPLHRVYLYGESDFNPTADSPMQQIYMLTAIGLIVVVIACVNFTNLATARAVTPQTRSQRAKSRWRASSTTNGSVLERISDFNLRCLADCPCTGRDILALIQPICAWRFTPQRNYSDSRYASGTGIHIVGRIAGGMVSSVISLLC